MRRILPILLLLLLLAPVVPARAADFDLNGPSLDLRRVQFCRKCDAALIVTTVPPGAQVQCPECREIQPRLPTDQLMTRMHQVCPACNSLMDVAGLDPRQQVLCGVCGKRQHVLAEAATCEANGTGAPGAAPVVRAVAMAVGGRDGQEPASAFRSAGGDAPGVYVSTDPNRPVLTPEQVAQLPVPGVFEQDRRPRNEAEVGAVASTREPVFAPEGGGLVVARVNDTDITEADVQLFVEQVLDEVRLQLGPAVATARGQALIAQRRKALRAGALETLIDRALILQQAERDRLEPGPIEVYERSLKLRAEQPDLDPRQATDEARLALILEKGLARQGALPKEIPEAEIQAYYEANANQFREGRKVRLRSLVLFENREGRRDARSVDEIAKDVQERLLGGTTWTELIEQMSEEPFGAIGGGFPAGENEPVPVALLGDAVQNALPDVQPGEIVGPIAFAGGLAFISLDESLPERPRPLDDVREAIRRKLHRQAVTSGFERWVEKLRARARIQVF